MGAVWKAAVGGVALLALVGRADHACASTVVLVAGTPSSISTSNIYTFGATSFTFSSLTGSTSGLEIEAIFNGRGGTEIEILKTSDIFSNKSGNTSSSLSFTLTVGLLTGNRGITSVTNILTGSDTVTRTGATFAGDNTYVTSVLSNFANAGTVGGLMSGKLTSNLTNTTTTATLSPSGSSFSFTDTLSDSSSSLSSGYTLKLSNVKLLFNPAPEPASLALVATGLVGLIAARRRPGRRTER